MTNKEEKIAYYILMVATPDKDKVDNSGFTDHEADKVASEIMKDNRYVRIKKHTGELYLTNEGQAYYDSLKLKYGKKDNLVVRIVKDIKCYFSTIKLYFKITNKKYWYRADTCEWILETKTVISGKYIYIARYPHKYKRLTNLVWMRYLMAAISDLHKNK